MVDREREELRNLLREVFTLAADIAVDAINQPRRTKPESMLSTIEFGERRARLVQNNPSYLEHIVSTMSGSGLPPKKIKSCLLEFKTHLKVLEEERGNTRYNCKASRARFLLRQAPPPFLKIV